MTDLPPIPKIVAIATFLASVLLLTGSAWPEPVKANKLKLEKSVSQARIQLAAGRYSESLVGFQKALAMAQNQGDLDWSIKLQSNTGTAYREMYRYQEALQSYLAARDLAKSHGRLSLAVALNVNLAALYLVLGDLDTADQAAQDALRIDSGLRTYRYQIYACLAELNARRGTKDQAVPYFLAAAREADQAGDTASVARIWDHLGELMLRSHDFAAAEAPLLEAFRLRTLFHDRDLRLSVLNVAWLRVDQGDLRSAAALLKRADTMPQTDTGAPAWFASFLKGRLAQKRGNLPDASRSYADAFREAIEWQEEIGPSDSLRGVSFAREEFQLLYESLTDTNLAIDPKQAVDAFEATELYRAAALRQTLRGNRHWLKEMPPAYWSLLARLREAQITELSRPAISNLTLVATLRRQLAELQMEHSSRGNKTLEKYRTGVALRSIQASLREDEALFSFYIGAGSTTLWAVTNQRIERYALPDAARLTAMASRFRSDIQNQRRSQVALPLYRALFQKLAPMFLVRRTWIISASDALFSIPFAALEVGSSEDKPVYLVEHHVVFHVPSAFLLAPSAWTDSNSGFVGMGDGIYNEADARWQSLPSDFKVLGYFRKPVLQLPRLTGSGLEISASASQWGGAKPPLLFQGSDASSSKLQTALQSHPAVLHLAAHVIAPSPDRAEESAIDLGLDTQGRPDILTSDDIAALDVSNTTVVMSGCSSASAPSVSGKGVLGLTRAWLLAGARVVVGSRWPTPDDTGELFKDFYLHLRKIKDSSDRTRAVARSLREAQLDMLRSGTWRSSTWYWGAFYALGKE